MLSNCDHEKMALLISSTTNEWPQLQEDIQIDDIHHQKGLNNNNNNVRSSSTSSPANRVMEKPGQEQLQLQQQALKCPRCDSSNTKFCYYNNYSLSQPRHFCKACKRYWTRGGTLRNVPVGGGCRKNKRVKRPGSTSSTSSAMDGGATSSSSSVPSTTAAANNNSNPNSQPSHIDQINPLFYGLSSNPFMDTSSGFDLHQLNHHAQLGLGFSSSSGTNMMSSDNYRNRFNPASSSSLPSNYSSMFSASPSTTVPTMASVLASKFINGGAFKDIQARGPHQQNQYFQSLLPFEDLQIAAGNNGEVGGAAKDVKVEDHNGQNRLQWNNNNGSSNVNGNMNCQNQISEQMGLSDPTPYWNSSTLGSNWHDPANLGSSVSSLI
ncbi:hypothetical protein ACFX19_037331 [Malus domestica]